MLSMLMYYEMKAAEQKQSRYTQIMSREIAFNFSLSTSVSFSSFKFACENECVNFHTEQGQGFPLIIWTKIHNEHIPNRLQKGYRDHNRS